MKRVCVLHLFYSILRCDPPTTTFSHRYGKKEAIKQFLSMRLACKKFNEAVLLNTPFWKTLYKTKLSYKPKYYSLGVLYEIRMDVLRKRQQQIDSQSAHSEGSDNYTLQKHIGTIIWMKRVLKTCYKNLHDDEYYICQLNRYMKQYRRMLSKHVYYIKDLEWLQENKHKFKKLNPEWVQTKE